MLELPGEEDPRQQILWIRTFVWMQALGEASGSSP